RTEVLAELEMQGLNFESTETQQGWAAAGFGRFFKSSFARFIAPAIAVAAVAGIFVLRNPVEQKIADHQMLRENFSDSVDLGAKIERQQKDSTVFEHNQSAEIADQEIWRKSEDVLSSPESAAPLSSAHPLLKQAPAESKKNPYLPLATRTALIYTPV